VIEILPGGLLDLLSDGLVFDQSYYHSGGFSELRNAAGGRIRKSGGAGAANFNDFLVVNDGVIEVAAGAIETNRLARLRHGGAIQGAGELVVPSGSVEVAGSTALQGGTLHIQGGYLWGDPSSAPAAGFTATGQGRVRWTQGWLGGTVALAAGTLMEISGAGGKEMDVATRLHNHGTLTWSGAAVYHNSDYGRAFAAIHNEAGGNLVLQSGGAFLTQSYFRSGGTSALHNAGTLRLVEGSPVLTTLGWHLVQTATGRIDLEVAGSDPDAPAFDRLQLDRASATLAGTLRVTRPGGYEPPLDTTFPWLQGGDVIGTFSSLEGSGFTVEYGPGSSTLRAVAAGPPTFAQWAADRGLSGPGDNSDGDDTSAFAEYAFHMDPTVADRPGHTFGREDFSGSPWIVFRYRIWEDRLAAGVVYLPEASPDLSAWDSAGVIDEADPDAPVVPGSQARRARIPAGGGDAFLHLQVSQSP
jgi:hypothetical protein